MQCITTLGKGFLIHISKARVDALISFIRSLPMVNADAVSAERLMLTLAARCATSAAVPAVSKCAVF